MSISTQNSIDPKAPIIVGVGQCVESVPPDLSTCSSHADITAKAGKKAAVDTGNEQILSAIDSIVCVRTFVDSGPSLGREFGKPTNFPRAVAKRLDINPQTAIYESVGGHSPQKLVGEFSEKLNSGEADVVLITGGEVIANMKAATKEQVALDWSEVAPGQVEDRGLNSGHKLLSGAELQHKLFLPMQFYALMEQARRADLGLSLEDYNNEVAEIWSQFSQVAKNNQYSMFPTAYSPEEISTIGEKNSMLQSPYTKCMVAKDGVNQGAALILTTVEKAIELKIERKKWVFIHGYATAKEPLLLERPSLCKSDALELAIAGSLDASLIAPKQIDFFDLYSCFPIVVSLACDALGIDTTDSRPLTQTGGLPFFGGPGNNYSTHGIASMVDSLRANPGKFGMVYANGGWMSKHSAGVYSSEPMSGDWRPSCSAEIQTRLDDRPRHEVSNHPDGEAILESYTINTYKGQPINSVVVGRLKKTQERFYATNAIKDRLTLEETLLSDKIGKTIYVESDPRGNRYAYSESHLKAFSPKRIDEFQDSYEHCIVEKRGKTLIVTINRPENRNSLHPPANQELENIFNAFEKDSSLWVAIITGVGDKAFSAGNDLKYQAKGGDLWTPKTGFGGLTARKNRRKPVIAAINGLAVGGGLEVALACDILVAADHAMLGLPEVKVGLYAAAGGLQRLTRSIGIKKATEMIITGDLIEATSALNYGLVNYVLPAEQVMDKALELADKVSAVSPTAVSTSLQVIQESSRYGNIDDAIHFKNNLIDNILNTGDFIEGPMAFVEKRKPKWEDPS